MDYGPLVTEEIDAGSELVREFNKYAPVEVAFWLKKSDDDFRYLYIASKGIEAKNIDLGYREVLRLANNIQSVYFDPFRVKLIGAENPLAKAALESRKYYPDSRAVLIGGSPFGKIMAEDGYIYPANLTATVP